MGKDGLMTNLPELIGSEKQIAWAESIRSQAIPAVEDEWRKYCDMARQAVEQLDAPQWIRDLVSEASADIWAFPMLVICDWYDEAGLGSGSVRLQTEAIHTTLDRLRTETDCRWWIDRNKWSGGMLVAETIKQTRKAE